MRWLCTIALLAACGAGTPDQAARARRDARYAAAEKAFASGDLAAAEGLFTAMVDDPEDQESQALARYRLAQIAKQRGADATADAQFKQVAAGPAQERAALAAYQLALPALDAGDIEPMRAVAEQHPQTVAADKAVRILTDRALDPHEAIAWLTDLAAQHPTAPVADNALWWAAHLRLHRLGDIGGARADLTRLARTWPDSPLVDETLWLLARLYRRQGQWHEAVATYDALAQLFTETSYLVGSYRSRHLDDALLARARVLYHGLGDCAAAADGYRRLLAAFESSVLRDDALAGLVQAERCLEQSPTLTLAKLRKHHPRSRYLRTINTYTPPDPAALQAERFAP